MPPRDTLKSVYRVRVTLFLLLVVSTLILFTTLYQGLSTLLQLGVIERERDTWQRPSAVLEALAAKEGNVVADLGCGSGYFTLKLSPLLGKQGRVLAVDIRRESLTFLWIRSLALPARNVTVIHGQPDDPQVGAAARLDGVLIANTYHEFAHPAEILGRTYHSLRPGARLVVIDRGPNLSGEDRIIESRHHELSMGEAANEIGKTGFEIIFQQDYFIYRPADSPWWLIVAVKP